MSRRSGVNTFFRATARDLEAMTQGALGQGSLATHVRPQLQAQYDALAQTRLGELSTQSKLASVRLQEALVRSDVALRLLADEFQRAQCTTEGLTAGAQTYGLAMLRTRAE